MWSLLFVKATSLSLFHTWWVDYWDPKQCNAETEVVSMACSQTNIKGKYFIMTA